MTRSGTTRRALGLAVLTSIAASATSSYVGTHGVSPLSGDALTHGYQNAFFVAGGWLLARVDVEAGERAAHGAG